MRHTTLTAPPVEPDPTVPDPDTPATPDPDLPPGPFIEPDPTRAPGPQPDPGGLADQKSQAHPLHPSDHRRLAGRSTASTFGAGGAHTRDIGQKAP
jgi:hypothetical protein